MKFKVAYSLSIDAILVLRLVNMSFLNKANVKIKKKKKNDAVTHFIS